MNTNSFEIYFCEKGQKMKNLNLSLIASLAIGVCTVTNATSLESALTSGKVSAELTTTYEGRSMDKELLKWNNYYNNTSYAVGSFALGYETGVWNNMSVTAKFRAYTTLFEGGDDEVHYKGTGDAAERFWETGNNDDIDFESLFLQYADENLSVKAGRQDLKTEWLNKTHDAINANYKIDNTNVEMIWTRRMGRVTSRDYRPLSASDGVFLNTVNPDNGVYKLGLSHDFGEVDLKGFYLTAPEDRDLIGGQFAFDNGTFGASTQYTAYKPDDSTTTDGSHTELKAFYKIDGYTATLAHLITKDSFKHFGMGTTNAMEEGDKIYTNDAQTTYVQLNKKFGDLSATLISGITYYDDGTSNDYSQTETTVWLGYPITKNLKGNLGYTFIDADNSDADETDINQLNLTVAYTF
jgi:hypothetical protein